MTGIDAHIHVRSDRLDPRLLAEGDRLGVDRFVGSCLGAFVQHPTTDEIEEFNTTMRSVMREHADRVDAYCYLNPRHGGAALSELRRCVEDGGMVGVKLWVATLCDDPLVYPIVEQAIAYRIPLLVHAWRKTVGQLMYESTAKNVAALAARYPEAQIIMAHLGGQAESAINAIAPYPNVCTDTSGSIIAGGNVSTAVRRLGVHRVIFGSDAPGGCLAANVGQVLGAGLDEVELDAVMGGNVARLLDEAVR